MAIKVRANERLVKFTKEGPGEYRYVLAASIYNTLSDKKVIKEAALRSGLSKGVIQASWEAIGDVISNWATEGHSVAVPGLGHMRFGLRATSVTNVNLVGTDLITSRRVIFTPSTAIKQELQNTSVNITCYDRNGEIVKRVTSEDDNDVEDDDDDETPEENPGGNNPGGGSGGGGNDDLPMGS